MNVEYLKYLLIYLLIINIIGFLSMGIDKFKAKHGMWRTPENTLLLISLLMGSVGSYLGMRLFRHKTLHPQFKYGIPVLFVVNVVCIYLSVTMFILE